MFPSKKIHKLVGTKIRVEMKGEKFALEGTLVNVDDYLNLYLCGTIEIVDGEKKRMLGSVVLRGNNIVLINPVEE